MLDRIDAGALTPMMRQYYDLKQQYKDAILMFRLGDFYEMFFDDALIASRELEITLTKRDCGLEEKAPMCGVPHHVSEVYINRLVRKGYKVAVCEQLEDPAVAKGLVKRDVTRVVTPGTIVEAEALGTEHNYLMSISGNPSVVGIAYIDVSTGDFQAAEYTNDHMDAISRIDNIISMISPSELIISSEQYEILKLQTVTARAGLYVNFREESVTLNMSLEKYLSKESANLLDDRPMARQSVQMLLETVYSFDDRPLSHIKPLVFVDDERYLEIDGNTRRNLELRQNLYDFTAKNTLFRLLDRSKTAMGSRRIAQWMERPLIETEAIRYRLDIVEYFVDHSLCALEIEEALDSIYDIERLLSKLCYGRGTARDLVSLKLSIESLPRLKTLLLEAERDRLQNLGESIDPLTDLYDLIDSAIVEDPPIATTEGEMIRPGFDKKLDELRNISVLGKERLVEYEGKLREETGIKNLRIVFNKRTGYFIEVTKSYLDKVPEEFIRKQTLTNSERYMTSALEEIEEMIATGQSETAVREYEIFEEIRGKVMEESYRIQQSAAIVSLIDALAAFASVSKSENYVKPRLHNGQTIKIRNGRHPIVEQNLPYGGFIPNNVEIGEEDNRIQIITGPNMGGKSTYMRQVALISILAQMGCFVPAESAELAVVDKVFTRIGASDNLAGGDSTFMLEMKEMSNIIRNATTNSLIILDEVGRGTSTFDGLSIAWSIVEYLSSRLPAKILFATHYHELTQLEDLLPNIKNLKVEISEETEDIVFLRKIAIGAADKSYGIEVAKLAGLPGEVIDRAKRIMQVIESEDRSLPHEIFGSPEKADKNRESVDAFVNELCGLDPNRMTPLEALSIVYEVSQKAKELDLGN